MARSITSGRVWAATLNEGLGRLRLAWVLGRDTTTPRKNVGSGRVVVLWVQRLKANVVLLQHSLIVTDAGKQLSLGEAAATLAGEQGSRHALDLGPHTVGAGELAVALDLALLAELAGEHLLGFGRRGCLDAGMGAAAVAMLVGGVVCLHRRWTPQTITTTTTTTTRDGSWVVCQGHGRPLACGPSLVACRFLSWVGWLLAICTSLCGASTRARVWSGGKGSQESGVGAGWWGQSSPK